MHRANTEGQYGAHETNRRGSLAAGGVHRCRRASGKRADRTASAGAGHTAPPANAGNPRDSGTAAALRPRRKRRRPACGSTASISRRSFESGIIANPIRPGDGLNLGQLFTDHANQVQLNQLLLTANKPLDPKNTDYQWGFKVQFMYGSDARYTQFLGELNRVDPGPALPARRGRGERPGASAVAHRRRHRPQGRPVSDAARLRDDRSLDQSVLLALLHLPVRPAVQAHRRAGDDARQ